MAVLEEEIPSLEDAVWPGGTPVGDVGRGVPVVAHTLQVIHEDWAIAESAVHLFPQHPLGDVWEVRVHPVIVAPLEHSQVIAEDRFVAD
ncbi:MAG TPA: hypothetical protein DGJ56_06380 [Verrucomicrobiales bacterium]|nr:hypothetical protein [Verrucomicrobiales bacterium]|tara:strand:+ start:388 stop:654 length:267 start_codon:yes stop_codon:yes gene_type:complete